MRPAKRSGEAGVRHGHAGLAALLAALSLISACGGRVPDGPGAIPDATRLVLACSAATLLAGDIVVCRATAGLANVSFDAAWTSTDPNVAASLGIGLFMGKADGQATLRATYAGQIASAPLTVHLEDVLRATAAAYQGTFRAGTSATLWLQGFYGVASAEAGTLTLVVRDQTDAIISTSAPLVVAHGADRYLISTTFTLPPSVTRVCREAVLEIGPTRLTVVPDASLVPCFAVTP
jgi:hypothetical protein